MDVSFHQVRSLRSLFVLATEVLGLFGDFADQAGRQGWSLEAHFVSVKRRGLNDQHCLARSLRGTPMGQGPRDLHFTGKGNGRYYKSQGEWGKLKSI